MGNYSACPFVGVTRRSSFAKQNYSAAGYRWICNPTHVRVRENFHRGAVRFHPTPAKVGSSISGTPCSDRRMIHGCPPHEAPHPTASHVQGLPQEGAVAAGQGGRAPEGVSVRVLPNSAPKCSLITARKKGPRQIVPIIGNSL